MKKFFNYRPLVSISLFSIAGIIFVCGFFINDAFHIFLSVVMLVLLIVTVVLKAVRAKEYRLFKIFSVIIAFSLFSLLTFLNVAVRENKNNYSGYMNVYGRIAEDPYVSQKGKFVVTLDHCFVEKGIKSEKVSGKVMLYLDPTDAKILDFKLGSTIKSGVSVSKPKISFNKTYFYYYTKNVSLVGYGTEEYVSLIGTDDRNLAQKYKLEIKESLDYHLNEKYSELAYTMLFGDRGELDEDISEIFKASGIAHLLAVSGLHVGFIVTLLSFILKLCKTNDKTRFVIISVVTFVYALLCGFTISVTRAFVMTFIMLYLTTRRKEYDSLSSLACACVVVLLFNPFQIYSAGFRLSFGAVLGIILLAKPLERFFGKFFKKKLSSALAVSLSAQIGTIPTLALCFKNVSVFSIFANMFAIPIASMAFMNMFSFSILGVIFKPLGFGLVVFEWLMKIVTVIGKIFGSVTFAGANRIWILIFSFFLILTGICSSNYLFCEKKTKNFLTIGMGVLSVICFVFSFVL